MRREDLDSVTGPVTDRLPSLDPEAAARAARLRYVSDRRPGITRRRAGKGFAYRDAKGRPIRDEETLERIRRLAIPPAWTEVWISPDPKGHIQATGRDARGRKQYRYHSRWRDVRDETKFGRMVAFGARLPDIRARVAADLARPGLPREKVLAAIVRLLETTLIRVGNEEYVRANRSFGLTTLRDRHVEIEDSTIHFEFRAKSGRVHALALRDRRLARIVKSCRDIPGQELFQYVDADGERRSVDSADVNDYLRAISGEDFTAKDFRTWTATVLALRELRELEPPTSPTAAKRAVSEVCKAVSAQLGNTPAVCRKSYIHPAVLDRFAEGELPVLLDDPASIPDDLSEEAAVLKFLKKVEAEAAGK